MRPSHSAPLASFLALALCACSAQVIKGSSDLAPAGDDAASPAGDAGSPGGCDNPLNLEGCGCNTAGDTRPCYTGAPDTENKGLCRDGSQTCRQAGEFNVWGPCEGDVRPAAEVCDDQLDHNCNGLLGCDDPDCGGMLGCCTPGDTRPCYFGPLGSDGVGPCHAGTQTCTPKGAWPMGCDNQVLPGVEGGHCHDNIDNDCNGKIDCRDPACVADPGCQPKQCAPGATRPCYSGPQGTAGVGPCKPGIQTCDQNGQWGVNCAGEVTPATELLHCHDNVDNDCNGLTDCKDLACLIDPGCQPMVCQPGQVRACYSGPQGTENVGPCKGGMQTCAQDGKSWGACMGEVTPGAEGGHCNDGVDNDCNGLVDCKDPACAAAPNCCVMGNVNVDGTIYVHSTDTLYTLDPKNWTLLQIGAFGNGDQMTDIAVTPAGQIYGISFTTLYKIDKATAKATAVGAVPGSGNNSLTFLPDGKLLAADTAGDVKKIDPANGQVTAVGNYGNSFSAAGDLVAVGDGTMYGTSATQKGGGDASGNNVLLRIDTKTGAATAVGPIGFGGVWGLAYAGARLIGFTNQGQVLQIDPQTGKGVLVANKGINFWGAGMSPLVPANQCP